MMAQQTRDADVTVFELDSEYDALDKARFQEFAEQLLAAAQRAEPPLIVLDFSQTRYVGSSFIETLVRAWKRLNERGGRLALCGVRDFCADVFRAARLDTIWPMAADRAAAIRAVRSPAGES